MFVWCTLTSRMSILLSFIRITAYGATTDSLILNRDAPQVPRSEWAVAEMRCTCQSDRAEFGGSGPDPTHTFM